MLQIYAHRGSSGTHPENTLSAFAEAVRVGADGIELDVHLSKDGYLIVMHDEEVDRTTNGKGLIREKTLEELKKLNAGGKFSKEFPAAKVPELREVLGLLLQKNYRGMLMIEIKTDQYEYPGIEEKLAETLKSRDWPFQHAYCSFHLDSLEKIALLEQEIQLDLLMSTSDKKVQLAAETPYIEGVHPKNTWLFEHPGQAADFPKAIRAWTINDEEEMAKCQELKIDGIITDFPEKALRWKQSTKSR